MRNIKYKTILLDADNTLFDYDYAEGLALKQTFEKFQLDYHESVRLNYQKINSGLWKDFEAGILEKGELQILRFEKLFAQRQDKINAAEFNRIYLDLLAENGHLIDGAVEVCKELSKYCTLIIATNGIARTQRGRLNNSEIKPYISQIIISEETGYQKPQKEFFEYAFETCGIQDKKSVLMVGDSLTTDMKGGINFKIATCWYHPFGEDMTDLMVDYEITDLKDLIPIIIRE